MDAWSLEQIIYDLEGIRVVVRDRWNAEVSDYNYVRKAAGNTSIHDWLQQRVHPVLNGIEVTVIDGTGRIPHGRTHLETVRNSYAV